MAKVLFPKKKCREALINKFSLKIDNNNPLLCMIIQPYSQKGIDFLMKASEDLKNQNIVVLGERDIKYENFLVTWQKSIQVNSM